MPRGPVARRLILGSARALLGVAAAAWASPGCYAGSSGSEPPASNFYYPVGLTLSAGGNVLYVVNSDFDLQWNGGTLQSYDLFMIRRHAAELIQANETGVPPMDGVCPNGLPSCIPLVTGYPSLALDGGAWRSCLPLSSTQPGISNANPPYMANGIRVFLNQGCSPPVDSSQPVYFKNSAIIGAFATDLQLSSTGTRLFTPVRGDATVTWAQLTLDDPASPPPGEPRALADASWGPFSFQCAQNQATTGTRCDAMHQAGNDANSAGNTRNATMPGEPFGIAQTEDGTAMAVTHQSTTSTSLLLTGIGDACTDQAVCPPPPAMEFVLDGVPNAGNGITPVPHDPDAVVRCEDVDDEEPCVHQAFLETNHSSAQVNLLRYFDSDGSSLPRPYLENEQAFAITTNNPGTDERGIVIDPTPSLKCKAELARRTPPVMCDQPGQPPSQACIQCGQTPSRVFIASRAPPSIIYGQIGQLSVSGDGTFNPDQLNLQGNVPLLAGPSRVYLAPIVDSTGHFALRLFVVCYDSAAVFVFDPEAISNDGSLAAPETIIYVGAGPFAMAFDPFTFQDVAAQEVDANAKVQPTPMPLLVTADLRQDPTLNLKTYRFAYLATFTNSYLEVIDLDDSLKMPPGTPNAGAANQETFEQIVFTLGQLTSPKGQ